MSRPRRKPKVGDLALVRWVDASRTTSWTYDSPDMHRHVHESVGWIAGLDHQALSIRPHRVRYPDGDEQHCGDMTIPRQAVLGVEVLR